MLENVNIVWWYVWPCYRSAFLLRSTRKTVKLIWCVVLHHEQAYSIFSHLEIVLVWWIRATFFFYSALFIIQFYFILFCVSLTQTQQWEQKKHWLCKHLSADNVNNKHKKWSTSIKKKYTARLNLVVMLDALHQMIIIMSLFVCITSCTFYIFFFMTQNCLTQSWRVDRLSGCLWPQVEWELVSGNPVSGIWSSDGPFLSFSVYF